MVSGDDDDPLARFKAEALRVHQEFEASIPTRGRPTDDDDVAPPSLEMLVHRRALELAPDHYAATYADRLEPGVINVGFTADANRHAAALRAAFPATEIRRFNARFAASHLVRIHEEITELMVSGGVTEVCSCGVDEQRNVVQVGVADCGAREAQALICAYGDAVDVHPDEPIELL